MQSPPSISSPGRMQPLYLDPQGVLYLTYSGKSNDDQNSKRMRPALGLAQLIFTKEQFNT